MGFDDEKKAGEENEEHHHRRSESEPPLSRHASESSIYATEDDDDEVASRIQLGPQCTLKEHLEKDKVCTCRMELMMSCFLHSSLLILCSVLFFLYVGFWD